MICLPVLQIGVSGSAEGADVEASRNKAEAIGKAIAKAGAVLVTGACGGLPGEAASACKNAGGKTIGISPFESKAQHVENNFPFEQYDYLVFSGMGKKGRNAVFVHSCDAMLFIGGGMGTLNEFTIAFDEGKVIGVLENSGGLSGELEKFASFGGNRQGKKVGVIVKDADVEKLVEKVFKEINLK